MKRRASKTDSSDIGDSPESKIPESVSRLNGAIDSKFGKNRDSLMIALFHAAPSVGKWQNRLDLGTFWAKND